MVKGQYCYSSSQQIKLSSDITVTGQVGNINLNNGRYLTLQSMKSVFVKGRSTW